MKFSTKEDIEAPIDAVFEMLSEFETFERAAMRRGAEVRCVDRRSPASKGMTWKAAFDMRGKRRDLNIELVTYDRPEEIVLESKSAGLDGFIEIELMALSRSQTRVSVAFEVKPLNLSTRLLVQSLKLAKSSLTAKYKLRVSEFAKGMEERYAKSL